MLLIFFCEENLTFQRCFYWNVTLLLRFETKLSCWLQRHWFDPARNCAIEWPNSVQWHFSFSGASLRLDIGIWTWSLLLFVCCWQPNCYSRIVDINLKKHIIIFALRRIQRGEELTYDYKFPLEDVKIPCSCGSRRCRKYLN